MPSITVSLQLKADKETYARTGKPIGGKNFSNFQKIRVIFKNFLMKLAEEKVLCFVMISNNLGIYSSTKGTFSITFDEENGTTREEWISSKIHKNFKF
jgi:hypothetical protein